MQTDCLERTEMPQKSCLRAGAALIALYATTLIAGGPAAAQYPSSPDGFKLDMNWNELAPKVVKLNVSSLGVGDHGYIYTYSLGLCRDEQNLHVSRLAPLETSRSTYSEYFKVTRLAGGDVDIETTDSQGDVLKGSKLQERLLSMTLIQLCTKLKESHWPTESTESMTFRVRSVNGGASLSALFALGSDKPAKQADAGLPSQPEPDSASTPTPSSPTWLVLEEKSPLDDSTNATLMLGAVAPDGSAASRGTLFIRCRDRKLDVLITAGGHLLFGDNDKISVTYRYDDEPAKSGSWNESTNSKAIFYPGKESDFIARLLKAKKFFIRIQPRRSAYIDFTFNVGGLAEHSAALSKSCKGVLTTAPAGGTGSPSPANDKPAKNPKT
ncbi:hypothetical protein Sp245p_19235 (plasmid) [Azospirillum baldaniorum]|uniref:Uncharacterized protein n=2 Tax=Azospirillum baldaniorum TaxID=1064539 RepID=A0A9P1JV60_9PROT|nr:hypothetical protein Sp245p_19235 [Azospirillum baldaniorum]CCD00363.1 protein of unknown function [Azospirillum baldaniorum]